MMGTVDPADPEAYRARVMLNVLNAVVEAGSVEGADECLVEMQMALKGVCDAIAMLVAAGGVDRSPKDRRDTADLCRRHILTASNQIAARVEGGEQLPWTMNPMGEVH
jgi:hypothetical protein